MTTIDPSRPENSRPDGGDHRRYLVRRRCLMVKIRIFTRSFLQKFYRRNASGHFRKIWVRDVVDLTIEVFRLRRLEANLIMVNAYKGLSETLAPLVGRSQAETLAEGWAAHKPEVVEVVDKTLTAAGLSIDSILAQTLSHTLSDVERIKHMTALAETRRNATLREIDRHRHTLSERLRWAAQQLEDSQFRLIESSSSIEEKI
jgi:hypothetical protein